MPQGMGAHIPRVSQLLMDADLNCGGRRITNLGAPVAATDAVSRVWAANRPSFSACKNVNQAIPVGGTKITWTNTWWDVGGYLDLINARYRPLVAGKYLFAMCAALANVSDGVWVQAWFVRNGLESYLVAGSVMGALGFAYVGGPVVFDMNGTTDYVECWIDHNDAGARNLLSGPVGIPSTWFQGALIDRT